MGDYHVRENSYVSALGTRRAWERRCAKLSDRWSSYWAKLAATGDPPHRQGSHEVAGYSASSMSRMIFGDAIKSQTQGTRSRSTFDRLQNESPKGYEARASHGGGK